MAHAIYIDPILSLQGSLGKNNSFYTRVLNGKNVIQSRPDRSRQQPSPAQLECRRRFVERYAQPKNQREATNVKPHTQRH